MSNSAAQIADALYDVVDAFVEKRMAPLRAKVAELAELRACNNVEAVHVVERREAVPQWRARCRGS